MNKYLEVVIRLSLGLVFLLGGMFGLLIYVKFFGKLENPLWMILPSALMIMGLIFPLKDKPKTEVEE